MGWKYVDVTEIAKLLRKRYKAQWPDTKFSVRCKRYSGGASISVSWVDGPTERVATKLSNDLQSVSHIDITDLVHYKKSEIGGEKVHSGASYIFPRRRYSLERIEKVADMVCDWLKVDRDLIEVTDDYIGARVHADERVQIEGYGLMAGQVYLPEAVMRAASNLADFEIDILHAHIDDRPEQMHRLMDKEGYGYTDAVMSEAAAAEINEVYRQHGWRYQWITTESLYGDEHREALIDAVMDF